MTQPPAVLMLVSSDFVAARHRLLREMAPHLRVVTDLEQCDPTDVDSLFAFKLPDGIAGRLPNLKLAASVGAGADGLLSARDLAPGVAVTRVVEPGLGFSMAQYVSYHLLRHFRHFAAFETQQRNAEWTRQPIPDARQFTVGLMGVGEIGRAVAQALQPLGFKLAGWTRSGRPVEGIAAMHGGADGLQPFLSSVDCLVCLLPFTADTRGLMTAQRLSQLKRGAFVVNAARGGIVDEAALLELIHTGHIAGAAFDVFETEPLPPDSPWWRHPRMAVTPHVAAQPSVEAAVRQFIDNLERLRQGQPLLHTVDRSTGY
ncbi:MAG: glyoxylate/hydroxypyruvate reductase [Rhizobacter sp.]|nr:glyoxylate/hydroxypyruvate reductase [Rhizobacter sp.]